MLAIGVGGRAARDDDAAAGAAGDHRPLGLLAGQAAVRLAEPTSRGSGPGSAAASPCVRGWSGSTTALVLGVMALGLTGLKASGLTNAQSFRGHPDSVTGQQVLDQHFPAGAGQPVVVVGNAAPAAQLAAALRAVQASPA